MNIAKKKTIQYISNCVGLLPKHLDNNIKDHVEELIKEKFGDKVSQYGYIYKNSIKNITYSAPRITGSHFNGHMNVNVSFQVDTYLPEINEIVIALVDSTSRILTILKDFPLNINVYNTSNSTSEGSEGSEGYEGSDSYKPIDYAKIKVGQYRQVRIKSIDLRYEEIECFGEIISEAIDKPTITIINSLPRIDVNNLSCVISKKDDIKPSTTLGSNESLSKAKDMIDQYMNDQTDQTDQTHQTHQTGKNLWSVLNGILHKYELINVSATSIVESKDVHAQYISRAYFKMWEMLKTTQTDVGKFITSFKSNTDGIICGSVAEGPGGFIKALCDFCSAEEISVNKYFATTLQSKEKHIVWSNTLLKNDFKKKYNTEFQLGDLYDRESYDKFVTSIGDNKCDIVTADGGIDVTADYNNQELLNLHLFLCEIVTALSIQKEKGVFIMKIYDVFYDSTLQLLQLTAQYYDEMCIFKPYTSKLANSEKYLIFKGFKGIKKEDLDKIVGLCYPWKIDSSKEDEFVYSFIENIVGYTETEKNNIDQLINFNKYLEIQTKKQLDYIKTIYIENDKNQTLKNIKEQLSENMKSSISLLTDLEIQHCDKYNIDTIFKNYSAIIEKSFSKH